MIETSGTTGGIQVISRAATILRLLAEHPDGLSLGAMAERVGLARSTVQRIVQALETEGFVEPSGPGGGFHLGPALSQLVFSTQTDIDAEVRPFIEALCVEIEETIALCALSGQRLQTIDRCVPDRVLRVVFPLGTMPHPAYKLAPGRAILAEMPKEQLRRLLAGDVAARDFEEVAARLAAERGAARDTETVNPGLTGFAVPLRTRFGLYAITAILPEPRVGGREDAIFDALRACRTNIEAKIGTPKRPD